MRGLVCGRRRQRRQRLREIPLGGFRSAGLTVRRFEGRRIRIRIRNVIDLNSRFWRAAPRRRRPECARWKWTWKTGGTRSWCDYDHLERRRLTLPLGVFNFADSRMTRRTVAVAVAARKRSRNARRRPTHPRARRSRQPLDPTTAANLTNPSLYN